MWIYYFFAIIVVIQGIASLRRGIIFLKYVRRELSKPTTSFTPFVSLIAPCRGLDQGLKENLSALFRQQYPAYELIFVTDRADDPSLAVVEELRRELKPQSSVTSRNVIAGKATESSQKVHNLLAAVCETSSASEVFAFVDTDARPGKDWLRSLVAPLVDQDIGATTGYRWFIPRRGGISTHLRAVWNASIASALGERGDKNFCWGGATALRRTTFERINVPDVWRSALSDDFALMRALRRDGLPIYFVPACLTPSVDDSSWRALLEFTTRQLKITRVYAPHFWKAVLLGSALFVSVFFGGLAVVITHAALGLPYAVPLVFLITIFVLGAGKAYLRLRAVRLSLNEYDAQLRKGAGFHLILWPFASALYLYNALAACISRRITWRGITYELKSPTETVIIRNSK